MTRQSSILRRGAPAAARAPSASRSSASPSRRRQAIGFAFGGSTCSSRLANARSPRPTNRAVVQRTPSAASPFRCAAALLRHFPISSPESAEKVSISMLVRNGADRIRRWGSAWLGGPVTSRHRVRRRIDKSSAGRFGKCRQARQARRCRPPTMEGAALHGRGSARPGTGALRQAQSVGCGEALSLPSMCFGGGGGGGGGISANLFGRRL